MGYKDLEVQKAWAMEYSKTPHRKKSMRIAQWKLRGVIDNDYNALYEQYLEATNCEACKSVFKSTRDRCLDHNHDTGMFRQFLCRSCNNRDGWKKSIYLSSSD
jgi:hypothetical protein